LRKIRVKLSVLEPDRNADESWRGKKRARGLMPADYSLDSIDNAATTKKAMPVQNRLPPVKNHTTMATRIAGINTRNSLMRTMIIKPIMIKTISAVRSKVKLPRTKRIIVIRIVLSIESLLENKDYLRNMFFACLLLTVKRPF
jgi:hypothetical protein